MENQFPVISDSYCVPYLINLRINTEKGITYDANNVRHFYIKDKLFTLHKRRVLCDNQGNPIVTLYKKMDNNDGFNVLVYPHADYAFIVALLMIVSEMKHYFDEMVYLAAGMAPLGVEECLFPPHCMNLREQKSVNKVWLDG
uniref:Uncharacterized protein n=1 Tax=Glycine max TaxID=3847 RepID=A0A0R0F2P0_SOYBN